MQIIFGTVIRGAPINQGGELVLLDWDKKQVQARRWIAASDPDILHDPNIRGNSRGCKGVQFLNGRIIAASYHTLYFFDQDLTPQGKLSHGLMADLHETSLPDARTIWVASTAIDAALQFDLQTGELLQALWPREMPGIATALGLVPLPIDKSADIRLNYIDCAQVSHPNHLHLNALQEWRGELYGLFNKQAAIANLHADKVMIRHPALKGAHNLLIDAVGRAFVNDTINATIVVFDLASGEQLASIDLKKFPWVRKLRWRAYLQGQLRRTIRLGKPLFLRGMDMLGDDLFVGLSPAAILRIDWRNGTLRDSYQYTDQLLHCVHGLRVIA